MMLPLQGAVFIVVPIPRALPWARWYCPCGANHSARQRPYRAPQGALHAAKQHYTARKRLYTPRKGPYTLQSSLSRRASALTRPAGGHLCAIRDIIAKK